MGRLGNKIKKYGAIGVKTAVGRGAMVGAGYLGAKTGDGGVSTSQESGTPNVEPKFFQDLPSEQRGGDPFAKQDFENDPFFN